MTVSIQSHGERHRNHFRPSAGEFFCSPKCPERHCGQPITYSFNRRPLSWRWRGRYVLIASSSAQVKMRVALPPLPQYLNGVHHDMFRFTRYSFIFAAQCPKTRNSRHFHTSRNAHAQERTHWHCPALPCPLQFVQVFWLLKAKQQNLSIQTKFYATSRACHLHCY